MNEAEQILVNALRSGKYKQGSGALEYKTCGIVYNCCLGVACQEYQKIKGDLLIKEEGGTTTFDGSVGFLPEKVQNWLGWYHELGLLRNNPERGNLAMCNDVGETFEQIADRIERGEVAKNGI